MVDIIPPEPAQKHFDVAKEAAAHLGAMVEGNGLTASQIRISKEDGHVHRLPAEVTVAMKPDLSHRTVRGSQTGGQVLRSKEEVFVQAEKIAQEFLAIEAVQQEIITALEKKPGRGFGVEPFNIRISQNKKEYSVVDKCLTCNGLTFSSCTWCHGTGGIGCTSCAGSGQERKSDGSFAQCHVCNGTRQIGCNACNRLGKIGCTECDQSGFTTHMYSAEWHAEISFALDRKLIPEDVLKIIDFFGVKQLATDGHAEIFIQLPILRDHRLIIPYFAFLPTSGVEFSVVGKGVPATVAGLHGTIIEIDPFLDAYLKPGINALYKLSKGPMAVDSLVQMACKYRVIRDVLSGLSHHKKAYVYQKITKDYPLVISDKYAKGLIRYAVVALLALSEKPRTRGLIIGSILAGGLAAAYFMTPVRAAIMGIFEQNNLGRYASGMDIIIYAIGCIIAIYTIKIVAAGALKNVLPASVTTVKDSGLPPSGNHGAAAVLTTLVLFLIPAFMTAQKPAWILEILARIGIIG